MIRFKQDRELQEYFKSFWSKTKNTDRLSALQIEELPEDMQDVICPILGTVMNVPVKLETKDTNNKVHTHYFDSSAMYRMAGIPLKGKHPFTRKEFSNGDVLPAPEMQEKIENYLQVEELKAQNTKSLLLTEKTETSRASTDAVSITCIVMNKNTL